MNHPTLPSADVRCLVSASRGAGWGLPTKIEVSGGCDQRRYTATHQQTTLVRGIATMGIFDRIKTWAVGPGGWLADSDKDEEYAAIDEELDRIDEWINKLRAQHRDGEDHPT